MAISNQEENGQEPDFANDNNTLLLIDSGKFDFELKTQ